MLQEIVQEIHTAQATLVAVSKTKPISAILEVYETGMRDFGENKVQELLTKYPDCPSDIRWHLIGHLQTNKVKQIVGKVVLIHSVDSLYLLEEIEKQSAKIQIVTDCLLQFHISDETTKFGFDKDSFQDIFKSIQQSNFKHLRICGVMGMATFTEDQNQIRQEFKTLRQIFETAKKEFYADDSHFKEVSMGMSDDYKIALEEGSTMVRVGSLLFGKRQ